MRRLGMMGWVTGILIVVGGCEGATAVEQQEGDSLVPHPMISDTLARFFATMSVGNDPGDQVIVQPNNVRFVDNSSGFHLGEAILQVQSNQNLLIGAAGDVILAPNGEDVGGLVEFTTAPTDTGIHLATQYYLPIRIGGVVRYLRLYT